MELNLNTPYGIKPSPPYKMELFFYSKDSDDLLFTDQQEIRIICHAGVHAIGLKWSVARNMFKASFLSGEGEPLVDNSFVIRIPAAKLRPGFYDISVQLDDGEPKPIDGLCTFGYKIDEMPINVTRPNDFAAFWQKAFDDLATIPLDPQSGPVTVMGPKEINEYNLKSAALPADYDPKGHKTEEIETCKVSFASANDLRVYGWLAKPVGKGPFPAMLVLPGGGVNARPIPAEHARHGYVALDIQAHGMDVDLEKYTNPDGYYSGAIFEPGNKFYFHRIYINCVRAVSYLLSRPDVDPKRIVVVGGSQGGRTSIVVAALDHRIAAAIPAIAHFGNLPYLRWAEACNTAKPMLDGMVQDAPPAVPDTPQNRCEAYYDIMNFAPDVQCPVLMNMGLTDHVSYPEGVYATYRLLGTKEKQIVPLRNLAHDWSAEFDRRAWRWLDTLWAKQK